MKLVLILLFYLLIASTSHASEGDENNPLNICLRHGGGSLQECARIVAEDSSCASVVKEEGTSISSGTAFSFIAMNECATGTTKNMTNFCIKKNDWQFPVCNEENEPSEGRPKPPPWQGCYCCVFPDKCND